MKKMAMKKGSLLEKNVDKLLKLVGLKPQLNKIYHGYEIDVFLRHKNYLIAFECKQYEKSKLTVRNIIHEWNSKNMELGFDKIVLVLFGVEINNTDKILASKFGIMIWDEYKLDHLLNGAIRLKEQFVESLISEIGVESNTKKEVKKESNLLNEKLKELIEQNKGKSISDDSSQSYPIFFSISKEDHNYLTVSYTRRNGVELMYSEDFVNNLKEDTIVIFEDILSKYSFVERKRKDIKEMQYHIQSCYITAALGKDLDFANEIITQILNRFGITNFNDLGFKFDDNSRSDGCMGCCGTGLIPTLILFLPFITIFPSRKVLLKLIEFHQKVTSPKLNKLNFKCTYEPSCSEYGELSIKQYGAIKGGWLSIFRIAGCRPKKWKRVKPKRLFSL